ncbi:hypothetical protein, partial [Citrobacter sp. wls826]|uniref:hypothetical protein n=1 Tax=Citrobacter sp. wls826 TaxID=2576415 RepID=UPI001BAFA543
HLVAGSLVSAEQSGCTDAKDVANQTERDFLRPSSSLLTLSHNLFYTENEISSNRYLMVSKRL